MGDSELLEKLKARVGKPAATLFSEEDISDRFLIPEITLSTVALFLFSKYLDGFIEGLGIKDVGKDHGQLIHLTFEKARDLVTSKTAELTEWLSKTREVLLLPYRENTDAKAGGEKLVAQTLTERGVPDFEADDIAEGMTEDLFSD